MLSANQIYQAKLVCIPLHRQYRNQGAILSKSAYAGGSSGTR